MPTVASRGAGRIAVEPQVFDLLVYLVQNRLVYLVQNRERVVSKDDLIALGPPIVAN
jgi:DNA-binding winged helix-turn-helix (wHTH) protein